jgi:streptogramin lyase
VVYGDSRQQDWAGYPGGSFTEFAIPTAISWPYGITSGPDGNLWFTENSGNKIGRITPGGSVTEFATAGGQPWGITRGPDGNLWFTAALGNYIGPIGTDFAIPTFNSIPEGIASGPDGNLWFSESYGNRIGRITTGGSITEFAIPTSGSSPSGITSGPDGNLWFTEQSVGKIGRITTGGSVTEFAVPTAGSAPIEITSGPDGNLWFTEFSGNRIGQVAARIRRTRALGMESGALWSSAAGAGRRGAAGSASPGRSSVDRLGGAGHRFLWPANADDERRASAPPNPWNGPVQSFLGHCT